MLVRPDTRPLLLALLASLLLHALLAWRLLPTQLPAVDPTVPRPLTIELRRPGSAAPAPLPQVPGPADLPAANADPAPAAVSRLAPRTAVTAPRRSLDLRLPPLEKEGRGPLAPTGGNRAGGTVVDPALAERLRDLRTTRIAVSRGEAPTAGRALGDRWESFVEVGGLCFRVIEADPLDSISRDQWFPVACDSP